MQYIICNNKLLPGFEIEISYFPAKNFLVLLFFTTPLRPNRPYSAVFSLAVSGPKTLQAQLRCDRNFSNYFLCSTKMDPCHHFALLCLSLAAASAQGTVQEHGFPDTYFYIIIFFEKSPFLQIAKSSWTTVRTGRHGKGTNFILGHTYLNFPQNTTNVKAPRPDREHH